MSKRMAETYSGPEVDVKIPNESMQLGDQRLPTINFFFRRLRSLKAEVLGTVLPCPLPKVVSAREKEGQRCR